MLIKAYCPPKKSGKKAQKHYNKRRLSDDMSFGKIMYACSIHLLDFSTSESNIISLVVAKFEQREVKRIIVWERKKVNGGGGVCLKIYKLYLLKRRVP